MFNISTLTVPFYQRIFLLYKTKDHSFSNFRNCDRNIQGCFFFWISSCPFSEHTEWNYTISQNHQHPASAFQNQKECRALKSRLLWGGDQAIYQNPRKVFGPRKGFFPSIFNDPRVFLCKVESRPGYLSILQRWKITNLENAVCVAWHYKWWVSFFHTRWVFVFKIL